MLYFFTSMPNWNSKGVERSVLSLSIVIISASALYEPGSENNGPVTSIFPEGSGIIALVQVSNVPSTPMFAEFTFLDDIARSPVCE
jgi:hypothetical protein